MSIFPLATWYRHSASATLGRLLATGIPLQCSAGASVTEQDDQKPKLRSRQFVFSAYRPASCSVLACQSSPRSLPDPDTLRRSSPGFRSTPSTLLLAWPFLGGWCLP